MKLESKVKVGSKEIKKYNKPRSPYRCLLESEVLLPEARVELTRLRRFYNPVRLQPEVSGGLEYKSHSVIPRIVRAEPPERLALETPPSGGFFPEVVAA
jgi:hypothetical protein